MSILFFINLLRQSQEEIQVDEDIKREAQNKRMVIDKITGQAVEVDIYDRSTSKKKVDPERARAMLSSNLE